MRYWSCAAKRTGKEYTSLGDRANRVRGSSADRIRGAESVSAAESEADFGSGYEAARSRRTSPFAVRSVSVWAASQASNRSYGNGRLNRKP